MSVYLDTGVLIALLYAEKDSPDKVEASARIFLEIQSERITALVTFYSLPELYSYVEQNYELAQVDRIFRESLIELLQYPVALKPFVERIEFERLRRRISIRDSYDAYHVAAALHYDCAASITFDHHFQEVKEIIPVFSPDEYLATVT